MTIEDDFEEEDFFEDDIPFPPMPGKAAFELPDTPQEIILKHGFYIPYMQMLSRDGGVFTAQYIIHCVKKLFRVNIYLFQPLEDGRTEGGRDQVIGCLNQIVCLECLGLFPGYHDMPGAEMSDYSYRGHWIKKKIMPDEIDLDYYNQHHTLSKAIDEATESGETIYRIAYALMSLATYALMESGVSLASSMMADD